MQVSKLCSLQISSVIKKAAREELQRKHQPGSCAWAQDSAPDVLQGEAQDVFQQGPEVDLNLFPCVFYQEHCSKTTPPTLPSAGNSGTKLNSTGRSPWLDFKSRTNTEIQHSNTHSNYNIRYIPLFCKDLRKNDNKKLRKKKKNTMNK